MKQTNPFARYHQFDRPKVRAADSTVKLIEPFILLAVYYLVMTFAFTV